MNRKSMHLCQPNKIIECMSAHVLLNLLNKFRKRDKMKGLPGILSLFRNQFKKFNNTGARMLDSIYHMAVNSFEIIFWG